MAKIGDFHEPPSPPGLWAVVFRQPDLAGGHLIGAFLKPRLRAKNPGKRRLIVILKGSRPGIPSDVHTFVFTRIDGVLMFGIIEDEGTLRGEGSQKMGRKLTGRQRQVLEYLVNEIKSKGYAPSVREIGVALGLRSPSTVHQHLTAIEQKGCIRRHGERMRALEIVDKSLIQNGDGVVLPLVGRISAGHPTLADEQVEEYVAVPPRFFGDVRGCFLLRIRGNSMVGAGMLPGDLAIVHPQAHAANGDIIVALLGEDATVKRLCTIEGRPALKPENPAYQPIHGAFQVIGRVVGTLRTYEEVQGWA